MKRLFSIFIFSLIFFISCFTTTTMGNSSSTQTSSTNATSSVKSTNSSKSRDLILNGEKYAGEIIDEMGGITSWYCTDWYTSSGNKVLLEVGYFNNWPNEGFILYDGTNEGIGDGVYHKRDGLDHEWWWGANENGGYKYGFVITPEGYARYYNFLEGETTAKPSSVYKAHKR